MFRCILADVRTGGADPMRAATYWRDIKQEPVQFAGFKLFYKNDIRNGTKMMSIAEVLRLAPKPHYIQYQ